ncbi:SDR family NAD(P)-dependent oxidoreductase [Tenacibaculum caenipelagi]|uniref:NAD(P)-dependent dehydrogenase (Short-subunit alcohol dehydrogenase family) n=1 Tax=Tenacibaculum caenipelagi TaxID=1325435 RepID=A0A4R6TIK5_9FLAO|nr:SDR family NAD(P)-dependent oxidoreductase [Tenacibaculum caenipelagi]TDQ30186.1 NAD(P)-dependent dehydrogenase (short-subunit alcohol dehydrogenase family) [Tenacibaculum caenipelagi]
MKTGIITGCSRGIGFAIANLLTDNPNYKIIGTSTSGNCPITKYNFESYQLNLSESESINNFSKKIKNIKIDFLINNAGILLERWEDSSINIQQLKQTFNVNLFGTIELTEKLIPNFKKDGQIINITSDWGSFSEKNFDEFQPHYKMSKTALNMYTKLLAKRLEKQQIIVSALDPGWTQTNMGGDEASRKPNEVAEDVRNLITNNSKSGYFWHQGNIREW